MTTKRENLFCTLTRENNKKGWLHKEYECAFFRITITQKQLIISNFSKLHSQKGYPKNTKGYYNKFIPDRKRAK